jgi:hypothetical protein
MPVEGKFTWHWKETAGRRYLFARPMAAINESDWTAFFQSRLQDYQENDVAILVDVTEIEEDMGKQGFEELVLIFKNKSINYARIGVISDESSKKFLVDLLKIIARVRDFDLDCEVFVQFDSAEQWLCAKR